MKRPAQFDCSSMLPRRVLSLAPLRALLGLCLLVTPPLQSAEALKSGPAWGSPGLGGGRIDRTTPGLPDNSPRFYPGFGSGILNAHWLLGAEFAAAVLCTVVLQPSGCVSGKFHDAKNKLRHCRCAKSRLRPSSRKIAGASAHDWSFPSTPCSRSGRSRGNGSIRTITPGRHQRY